MIGRMVSHYRVTQQLGAGAMGVVYRAEDTRLGRSVALKFLPPSLLSDSSAQARFVTEAKAASALDHPNICTIYDIGSTDDGHLFIAMACYEGETLKDRLAQGPLAMDSAIELISQVARGLARAHEQGIIHRDIKPANIFICRDGQVKLLDFGVAKLSDQTRITHAGTIIGTAHYMSPEQAQGREADARSDLFSLGIVLYETLSGLLPFRAEHLTAIFYQILHTEPVPLRTVRPELPGHAQAIIDRILAKRPSARYQSADELLGDLERLASGKKPAGPRRPSIAVLPFEDLSDGRDQAHLCDGIADELINNLTHIESLRVTARTSAFAFRGLQVDAREIGQKLAVQTLLTGSLRKSGDRLRITVQLTDVGEGHQRWSERYDRKITDVFAIQDEIAFAIVDSLKLTLLGKEKRALSKSSGIDITTYNLYLRGRFHWNERTEDALAEAVRCFEQAIARRPDYALAHAGIADSLNMLGAYGLAPGGEVYARAKLSAQRALAIDPNSAEAYASLAWALYEGDWDWQGAERHFRQSIALKPGYSVARMWYAHFLMVHGRLDEAIQEFEQALAVDPFALVAHANIGCCHYYAGRLERSKEVLRATLAVNPEYFIAHLYLGWVHLAAGDVAEAVAELKLADGDSDIYNMAKSSLGYAYGIAGMTGDARAVLAQLQKLAAKHYVSAYDFALVHLGLGEIDQSLGWLERSCTAHESLISYIKVNPLLDGLRGDPRFIAIAAKVGFAETVPVDPAHDPALNPTGPLLRAESDADCG